MTTRFSLRSVATIVACLAVLAMFASCGGGKTTANGGNETEQPGGNDDNDNTGGDDGQLEGNPITASDLLLPQGFAWISGDGEWANGFIFNEDGSVLTVYRKDNAWAESSTQSYTVDGNKVTRFMLIGESRVNETVSEVNISADGNTLYILNVEDSADDVVTYKKTEIGALS